ncbi:hypothetical protein [Sinosporangium siamense]|uniref:Uncharacterized protein n=1 Tax=Sinosporangium siamense TaxID=1367973 RepID=A0A919RG66_9ACTN|nr:hypothetical protein [Sinosporangium siamense]GII92165.1 hypothetical protein Ssi02_23960 [Sinosporangium siamense]
MCVVRWVVAVLSAAVVLAFPIVPPAAATAPHTPVVLVGVPGLSWGDVTPERTPHLWRLAERSAAGSLSVRTAGPSTCPYEGWLSVSAGDRVGAGPGCGMPAEPVRQSQAAVVPRFAKAKGAGTLGQAMHDAGRCALAVGPGAALALADRDGRVDRYFADLGEVPEAAWRECQVIAIDVDDLAVPYFTRARAAGDRAVGLSAVDAQVGRVVERAPEGAALVLAGLSDLGASPGLRVVMVRTADAAGRSAGSGSTRRDDMAIVPDLTATVLNAAGAGVPPEVSGVPITTGGAAPMPEAASALARADVAGRTAFGMAAGFFVVLAVLHLVFYAAAYALLRGKGPAPSAVRVVALGLAALPVGAVLANAVPWEWAPAPTVALGGAIAVCTALVTAVALIGPWRAHALGPPAAVAAITAVTLGADVLGGTSLQFDSVAGVTGVDGSRYYGLGNIPFAMFAASVLFLTGVVAHGLSRRGWRGRAAVVVVMIGGAAMLVGGWPGAGSDFGGVVAFVPGIAVTALLVAGRGLSPLRVAVLCGAGGAAVTAIAFLDHLRPVGEQTHFGRFFSLLVSGEAWPIVARKLAAMAAPLSHPVLGPIVVAAVAAVVFALLRPGVVSAGVLPALFRRAPALKAGLAGVVVSGVVGTLVNDSGFAVLAMALGSAVPLALAAGMQTLRGQPGS